MDWRRLDRAGVGRMGGDTVRHYDIEHEYLEAMSDRGRERYWREIEERLEQPQRDPEDYYEQETEQ